jgi:hypothetical protein
MKPFIIRYAKAQLVIGPQSRTKTAYNVALESITIGGGKDLAIDVEDGEAAQTGSTITRAMVDPTKDEPTDR